MRNGIASVGECMLELSGTGEGAWRLGYAGDTFNTLWTLRALVDAGQPTDYVSAFGDDPFSEQQIAFFKESGIGIASSPRLKGARPGIYAITLSGAERSFTYWRNDAAARELASDPAALAASSKAGRSSISPASRWRFWPLMRAPRSYRLSRRRVRPVVSSPSTQIIVPGCGNPPMLRGKRSMKRSRLPILPCRRSRTKSCSMATAIFRRRRHVC